MHKFNRIFNSQYMLLSGFINVVDHSRKRCRFTRAGRAGNQNKTTRIFSDALKNLWSPNVFKSQNSVRNSAESRCRSVLLHKDVGSKTSNSRHSKRKINLKLLF